jgi:hypothetical protein
MNPFKSIVGGQADRTDEFGNQGAGHKSRGQAQPSNHKHWGGTNGSEASADTPENLIFLRPVAEPSPTAKYLDQSVDLESLRIPFARFPGTKMVVPEQEAICLGRSEFLHEIAPDPAPVIERKDRVPYYIAGTLKEAELLNTKLREQRLKNGQSTIGKQRSGAHIQALGPALLLDDDGDVFSREAVLRALGAAAVIYSSHSFGFLKDGATELSCGGRIVFFLNRPVSPSEYGPIWDAINHLLGSGFDEHGRSAALCYGRHARRSEQASYRRLIIDGAALDADALLEFGLSLRPACNGAATIQTTSRKRVLIGELERARLMGAVRSPDAYGEWVSGAAAFKRAFPEDNEAAFQCFDVWSACSSKYLDAEATRAKFDVVPAVYEGTAVPVTLDMLQWRARRRAEAVIGVLYSPAVNWQKPGAFKDLALERLSERTTWPKGGEPIPPNSLDPEDGTVALEYLFFCWSAKVCQTILEAHEIPQSVLDEARRRSEQRNEKINLAGRTLHTWDGKNLAAGAAALADAIVAASPHLYRIDKALVRIAAPGSDPATAARVRKIYGYEGRPGEAGDPALHAGRRPVPILPSDTEALRDIIAENLATKRRVNDGTKANPKWREEIASFAFKPSATLHEEPDAGVLKDLGKRLLAARVPEIFGVITAPLMPNLPPSTKPDDLLKAGADRLITSPGFDSASGLYLSPVGSPVEVPESPSEAQVKSAVVLLQEPWVDFPFASPGEDMSPDVSKSAAIFAMLIAANRRALQIAPGIAFSSHGEGMSSGKTLAGEIICTIATGDTPTPVSLSPDFSEQRKEIITQLVEGDGCYFLDNIPNGTRFDSATLAAAMTSSRYKGRLLGTNKTIEASTRTNVVATGNALNLAGDLASRIMVARLDTGLERPEDRSVTDYKIPELRRWVVGNRQELVAAVHTIVRGYIQECRRHGGTPEKVASRREVPGTRFGGPCEVLRDAFLWAFPHLLDPFLSFKASAANSSTKAEAALVLSVLDKSMAEGAGRRCAPAWANAVNPPERWSKKFKARWSGMAPDRLRRQFRTDYFHEAHAEAWRRIQRAAQVRAGRRELRAGGIRFTSSEIINLFSRSRDSDLVEGALHGKRLNPISLGRWLKDHLVDAPINGRVLRSATGRENRAVFWITNGDWYENL